jgi:hypothetical protein
MERSEIFDNVLRNGRLYLIVLQLTESSMILVVRPSPPAKTGATPLHGYRSLTDFREQIGPFRCEWITDC